MTDEEDHLEDLSDGAGCAEVAEYLSEDRAECPRPDCDARIVTWLPTPEGSRIECAEGHKSLE